MSLAEIRLQEGESLENALRRFKRKVQTEEIIKDVKRHSYYLKPGREASGEASFGAKARPKKDSQRARLSCNNSGHCCQSVAFPFHRMRSSAESKTFLFRTALMVPISSTTSRPTG